MGFYPSDSLVHEAQRRGMEVLPPCVARSRVECFVEDGTLAVRIGLGYVNGVKEREIRSLVAERERGGAYRSVGDMASRSGAAGPTLEKLAWAGACDELVDGGPEERRRRALWLLGAAAPSVSLGDAGDQLALPVDPYAAPELREQTTWERLLADYGSTGHHAARAPAGADARGRTAGGLHLQR